MRDEIMPAVIAGETTPQAHAQNHIHALVSAPRPFITPADGAAKTPLPLRPPALSTTARNDGEERIRELAYS